MRVEKCRGGGVPIVISREVPEVVVAVSGGRMVGRSRTVGRRSGGGGGDGGCRVVVVVVSVSGGILVHQFQRLGIKVGRPLWRRTFLGGGSAAASASTWICNINGLDPETMHY